ncbi:uncharacterized protein [Typha latifolia]|uniref:uncharacterized protein n=1 Tax=Typha latifolia TaxID=4733 RepID=UPI003C308763
MDSNASCTVQHVTKASSDELLRKFADPDADPAVRSPRQVSHRQLLVLRTPALRRKRSSRRVASGLSARDLTAGVDTASRRRRSCGGGAAEWKAALLLPTSARKPAPLVRRMGIGRWEDATGVGILLAALEKTWRRTIEGTSKMFVQKHCSNHVRLISDIV